MKRILFILPNLDLGGTEMVVMNYFRAVGAEAVFDFVVHGEAGYFENEARARGARIFRVPARGESFWDNVAAMHRIYSAHPEYDCVVVCTEHSFAFIELAVAWVCGVKTRAAWSHFSDYQGASSLKRRAHFLARPLLRCFANLYLACTKDAGRWLFGRTWHAPNTEDNPAKPRERRAAGLDSQPIKKPRFFIINNAISTARFAYDAATRENTRTKLGLNKQFTVGIVGRLASVKNHAFALAVFAAVQAQDKNAVLLVVGAGVLREKLEQQAEQLGVASQVIFTGAVEDIHEYYQAMDAVIVPSLHEGFCIAALEAQAAGLPVLLSNTVPREATVSELAVFKGLHEGAEAWAETLLSFKGKNRASPDLRGSGFDITTEAKILIEVLERKR